MADSEASEGRRSPDRPIWVSRPRCAGIQILVQYSAIPGTGSSSTYSSTNTSPNLMRIRRVRPGVLVSSPRPKAAAAVRELDKNCKAQRKQTLRGGAGALLNAAWVGTVAVTVA